MDVTELEDGVLIRILEAIQERIDDGEADLDEDPFDSTNMEMLDKIKTNYYNTRIDSYYPIDKDILYDLQSNGEYQYWEGNRFDTDYHDTDVTNDSVVEVTKIKRK